MSVGDAAPEESLTYTRGAVATPTVHVANDFHPLLALTEFDASDAAKESTYALITKRTESMPLEIPGWTSISDADVPKLRKPSFVTPTLASLLSGEIKRVFGVLSQAKLDAALQVISTTLSTEPAVPLRPAPGYLSQLPPPSRRHPDVPFFRDAYAVLRNHKWTPPEQGQILVPHGALKRFEGLRLVVVSNTHFNMRYRYPQFYVVPLMPLNEEFNLTPQGLTADGRVVFTQKHGLDADYVALEEDLRTIDIAQNWYDPCGRCFDGRRRPWRFKVPATLGPGGQAAQCLRCDENARPLWPQRLTTIAVTDPPLFDQLMRNVRKHLQLSPENS